MALQKLVNARRTTKGRSFTPEEIAQTDQARLAAENEVIQTHTALENAETDQHERGLALARALKQLKEACKGKDYMARLTALGIKYERARYWTDVLDGRRTNRHKDYWLDELGATPNRKNRAKSRKVTLEFETVEDKIAFQAAAKKIGIPAVYRAVIEAEAEAAGLESIPPVLIPDEGVEAASLIISQNSDFAISVAGN